MTSEKEAAWNYFEQQFLSKIVRLQRQAEAEYLSKNAKEENDTFWTDDGDHIRKYKEDLKNLFSNERYKGNPQAQGLFSLAKKLDFRVDQLGRDEFIQRYRPFAFKNDFLPAQLGKVFWDYYIKYRNNQVNRFSNKEDGTSLPVLSDDEFKDRYGEKPWDLANRILDTFDSLNYRFSSPEGLDIFGNYQLKLIHTEKENLEVDFHNLSSGERVLMALVASIYKTSSDQKFPDLLLLDEIDASLHPSMIKNMLKVVREIFLPEGVRVILVTHSPTTIALSPDEAIFVMNRSGRNRLEKSDVSKALSILTQGDPAP